MKRHQCPECGRMICSTDDNVYSSVPDRAGKRFPYVHLRRHKAFPATLRKHGMTAWCSGFAARVDAKADARS